MTYLLHRNEVYQATLAQLVLVIRAAQTNGCHPQFIAGALAIAEAQVISIGHNRRSFLEDVQRQTGSSLGQLTSGVDTRR